MRPWYTYGRFQLLVAFVAAVVLPAAVSASLNPRSLSDSGVQNTLVAVSFAILAGVLIWRRFDRFPMADGSIYVLWAFIPTYFLAMFVLLLFRANYNRFILLASGIICVLWFIGVHFASRRVIKPHFWVIPGGNVGRITKTRRAKWHMLESVPDFANGEQSGSGQREVLKLGLADPTHHSVPGYYGIVADLRHTHGNEWERFIAQATLHGIPVYHYKQLEEQLTGRVSIEFLSENGFGSLLPDLTYLKAKRVVDFLLVIVLAPVLVPILLVVAALIYMKDGSPVLFRQERTGFRGQTFTAYKFRTMINRPDEKKAGDGAMRPEMTQANDSRITPLGHFLRKSRLDELPQAINILKGEMSWIGPRPEAKALADMYEKELAFYAYRHAVRPGISGWAQVSQGHVTSVDDVREKLKYDFFYIKHVSPWLDMLIVLKTVVTMASGFGAK